MLVRSSARVHLEVQTWRVDNDVFVSESGDKLSDHDPIAVRLIWSAVP